MTVSRRKIIVGAAAAAGVAALPPMPSPVAAPVPEAVAPTVEFFRHGVSLDGGRAVYAVYERLADGVIRVIEDEFGPGEILSFRANGLGALFDISTPSIDYDGYVRPDDEDDDADQLDDFDYFQKYGRERWVEPSYEPAHFDVAPGERHYGAVLAAMGEAEAAPRPAWMDAGVDSDDEAEEQ